MAELPLEVTAAALSCNLALWQGWAQRKPVVVTHHGRARSELIGIDNYRRGLRDTENPLAAQLLDEAGAV